MECNLGYNVSVVIGANFGDDAQLKYLQALFDNIGDSADHAADKIENIEKQIAKFGEQMEHQKEGLIIVSSILRPSVVKKVNCPQPYCQLQM